MSGAGLMKAAAVAACLVAGTSGVVQAQGQIYPADQLTERPQLLSPTKAAQLLTAAYPRSLQEQGKGGTVQLTFVVSEAGKVEPSSVEVMMATEPLLKDPAQQVAQKLEFKPGKKDSQPVRCRVVFPLTFR